jgi:hypothetical protein
MISTQVSQGDVRTSIAPTLTKKRHASSISDGHVSLSGLDCAATKMCGVTRDLEYGHSCIEPEAAMRGAGECGSPNLF